MRKQIIHIPSLAKSTQVTIRNGHRKSRPRQFASIDKALAYVLPLGSRHTRLYLNGYPCVLHGWVQGPAD
jgi:hypothetical protein